MYRHVNKTFFVSSSMITNDSKCYSLNSTKNGYKESSIVRKVFVRIIRRRYISYITILSFWGKDSVWLDLVDWPKSDQNPIRRCQQFFRSRCKVSYICIYVCRYIYPIGITEFPIRDVEHLSNSSLLLFFFLFYLFIHSFVHTSTKISFHSHSFEVFSFWNDPWLPIETSDSKPRWIIKETRSVYDKMGLGLGWEGRILLPETSSKRRSFVESLNTITKYRNKIIRWS